MKEKMNKTKMKNSYPVSAFLFIFHSLTTATAAAATTTTLHV